MIAGEFQGAEKARRIETIVERMTRQGQLKGCQVNIKASAAAPARFPSIRVHRTCHALIFRSVSAPSHRIAELLFTLESAQATEDLVYKLYDSVSAQYEATPKKTITFSRGRPIGRHARDADSTDSDSD